MNTIDWGAVVVQYQARASPLSALSQVQLYSPDGPFELDVDLALMASAAVPGALLFAIIPSSICYCSVMYSSKTPDKVSDASEKKKIWGYHATLRPTEPTPRGRTVFVGSDKASVKLSTRLPSFKPRGCERSRK